MIPKILSIAGSDPSGGAGIQADLKTFSALGCYGMAVITACTAQNTKGVSAVEVMPAEFVRQQLCAIFDDIAVHAVKIGMIADAEIAGVVADVLEEFQPDNIVLDPVMVATSGDALISNDAMGVLKARLIPLADVITPNIPELATLLGQKFDPKKAAEVLNDFQMNSFEIIESIGARSVLLTGGHDDHFTCVDIFGYEENVINFEAMRENTENTHGTGCTLSAAIAAELAKGSDMINAIGEAKSYITQAIRLASELDVGAGSGPVHHFWKAW